MGNPQVQLAGAIAGNGAASVPTISAQGHRSEQADQASLRLLAEVVRMQTERTLHLERALEQREAEMRQAQAQREDLGLRLAQRDVQVAYLEARAGWLEEQSRAARGALEAVENGRVMRILRWLSRAR